MKTMLQVSLGLMVVAGVAGSVNFFSLLRSGEINKIYSDRKNIIVVHVPKKAQTAAPVVLTPSALADEQSLALASDAQPVQAASAIGFSPIAIYHQAALISSNPVSVSGPKLVPATGAASPVVTVMPKQFNIGMYSRAPLNQYVYVVDSSATDSGKTVTDVPVKKIKKSVQKPLKISGKADTTAVKEIAAVKKK